ncbi:hypothetical protein HK107_03890 [Parvularcula sp. ZS-1/3]|uniref:DnaJ domain-containing protein n=1 Tax=Parvularcula mediterranea TaxID=2732508 RepID=A0A7Y3RL08_9PROT|nr:hypothetical protein [Parvularcula mediterranea]NNU15461.1 hypothetical protein [Parvularcula mediterranea]
MVLFCLAALLVLYGVVEKRFAPSVALRRRLMLIGATTAVIVFTLGLIRLAPLAALATVIGVGVAASQLMQEVGRRGDFEDDLGEPAGAPPPPPGKGMGRDEAMAVLGLEGEPDREAIVAAHKRMIMRAHPDQGGSDYLAAKVNEAKGILLPKN